MIIKNLRQYPEGISKKSYKQIYTQSDIGKHKSKYQEVV